MAILNEWAVMGPNYFMLFAGSIALIAAFSLIYFIYKVEDFNRLGMVIACISVPALVIMGCCSITLYDHPSFEIPTDKSYIEATFANGAPTAAVLQKYDVIDTDGKVYTLREKDDYNEEKRAKVRIGEKNHD